MQQQPETQCFEAVSKCFRVLSKQPATNSCLLKQHSVIQQCYGCKWRTAAGTGRRMFLRAPCTFDPSCRPLCPCCAADHACCGLRQWSPRVSHSICSSEPVASPANSTSFTQNWLEREQTCSTAGIAKNQLPDGNVPSQRDVGRKGHTCPSPDLAVQLCGPPGLCPLVCSALLLEEFAVCSNRRPAP